MKSWKEFLERESKEEYFIKLMQKVDEAYAKERVYPVREELFSCFDLCPLEDVKVVVIGQDPYHGEGQAHGLSFSVKPGIKVPPSLKNIYKELKTDLNIDAPNHGYLASWARQGVLLMNTSWSVTEGKAGSHKNFGWTKFTQRILDVLNNYDKPIVFILWGNHAIDAAKGINNPKHLLLKAPHPSPLAGGGFFGTKPFSQTNAFLEKVGRGAIDWRITDNEEVKSTASIQAPTTKVTRTNAEKPVEAKVMPKWPPKFKKLWTNIKEVDTSNDQEICEYPGGALQIIELNGRKVLLGVYRGKLDFLDPETFKPIDKSVTLATGKIHAWKKNLVQINGEWCLVYVLYKDDREASDRFRVVVYNLITKETTTLQETAAWVQDIAIAEIEGQNFVFVAYDTEPEGYILKYNLQTMKEELRFTIPQSDHTYFHYFVNKNKPTLLIEHKRGVFPESEYDYYKLFDANTGEQIGHSIEIYQERDTAVVQVADNEYVLAIATKANHLHVFDTATGEQLHDILVDEDPEYTISVFSGLSVYKSKLIVVSWDRSKVYDMTNPTQEPKLFRLADGSPVGTKDRAITFEYKGKPVAFFPSIYINKQKTPTFFSLDTYEEIREMKGLETLNLMPYTDSRGRELYIISKGSSFNGDPVTVLFNPEGRIRPEEEYEYNYYAVNAKLDGKDVILTRSTTGYFSIFDVETGKEIKRIQSEYASRVSQMKVVEKDRKQLVYAMIDKTVQSFVFPEMTITGPSFTVNYATRFDIVELEGKKQLIAGDETIYTWDLETGEYIHNPLNVEAYPEEEEEDRYIRSDGFTVKTLNWGGKDLLYIASVESSSYLWNPENPKDLRELDIDNTMWGVDSDDPDYCMYCAIATNVDGRDVLVAGSHHGAVVVYNAATLKRVGRIMRGRFDFNEDYINLIDFAGNKILITNDIYSIKLWNLPDTKKLKDFSFDGKITSIAVSGNKIIVFHGEDVTAIGLS